MTLPITVVIPAYNRLAELERALQSLVTQTCKTFEVVVCDDGSSEDVRGVVSRYADRLRLQYVRIENSGSPARPRNAATSLASGTWISFLDSDDWWKPERIECILSALASDVDVVYHKLHVVFPEHKSAPRGCSRMVGTSCGADPLRFMVTRGNPIPNSAALVRRTSLERLGGISEDRRLAAVEDFDTWLQLATSGARFLFVDSALGYYSVTPDSISTFSIQQLERQKALFDKHLPIVPERLKAMANAHFNYLIGSYALRLGLLSRAREHLALVQFGASPARWVQSMIKRTYLRLRPILRAH